MGAASLMEKVKAGQETTDLSGKKTWTLTVRFDLTDEKQKQVADDINQIIEVSRLSGQEVGMDLVEEGLNVFKKEVEAEKEPAPKVSLKTK